jgi:apolipoprotein N-acyltransferase
VDAIRTSVSWFDWAWFPLYANTQVGNVPFLQLASWGGIHLVTFAALGVAAAVAYWLTGPFKPFRAAWAVIILAVFGALWLGGRGAAKPPENAPELTVACVQTGDVSAAPDYNILVDYETLTDEALNANPDVDLAVWTETLFCDYADAETRAKVGYYAWSRRIFVVFDCYEKAGDTRYNTAVMLDRNGREILKWRKRHPAPGEPSDRPPKDEPYGLYDAPWGPTGLLICYDDHFPRVPRRLAREGARVFLIPSNDYGYGDEYFYRVHLNNAVFRAVENRCTTAVAAYDGYSAVIDDAGRLIALKDDHEPGWITATVHAGRGATFYTKHPWVFHWLYIVAAAFAILGGITGRDRLKKKKERKKDKWWG